METRTALDETLQAFETSKAHGLRKFWWLPTLVFPVVFALTIALLVRGLQPEPRQEGANSSKVDGTDSPQQNRNEPPETPQNSPAPKAAETPPKPPAPKGFFKDGVHLGMTREEVRKLVGQWNQATWGTDTTGMMTIVSNTPYPSVERLVLAFEDNNGLSAKGMGDPFGMQHLRALRPEARLVMFVIRFKGLEGESRARLLETLRETFGPPTNLAEGLFKDAKKDGEAADTLEWYWPDVDRSVAAGITKSEKRKRGEDVMTATLVFLDGHMARVAVQETLKRERDRTVMDAIRSGNDGKQRDGKTEKLSTALPIPETALGRWRIRGDDQSRWEGYLILEKSSDPKEARGTLEWFEGPGGPSDIPVTAALTQLKGMLSPTFVLRAKSGTYVAALSKEKDALLAGEWKELGIFSWSGCKIPSTLQKTEKDRSVAGTWKLEVKSMILFPGTALSTDTFVLHEEGELYPLRKVSGHWTSDGSKVEIHGCFDFQTRRLYVQRKIFGRVHTLHAYLTDDGTTLVFPTTAPSVFRDEQKASRVSDKERESAEKKGR